MPPVRGLLVLDPDGLLVADFADWTQAHSWAHLRAAEPGAALPIRVEDPARRQTLEVDAAGCRLTRWQPGSGRQVCRG